ncbi:MAG: hypothetical protein EPO08_14405 [Rhodospirillaceae bacterium]|nr:MAG: hypothetical protein EPO08_14405 [Rhodospirillaceae bacterium]
MDERSGWAWRVRIAVAVGMCLFLVSACFVPDHYEAEIRFTKIGAYGITYNGILVHAPLFSEIAKGNVNEEEAQTRIKGYVAQLKQDDSFKEVNSLGRGRFQVKYEREGRFIGEHQMVTFVSRQAPIFRLRTFEDGRISVAGSGAGRQYADKLEAVGLNSQGLFRVVTDAEVIEHNAQFVRASTTPGFTVYDWRIRGFRDPPPRLIAKLTVDPKTGGPLTSKNVGTDSGAKDDSDLDALAAEALKKQQQK